MKVTEKGPRYKCSNLRQLKVFVASKGAVSTFRQRDPESGEEMETGDFKVYSQKKSSHCKPCFTFQKLLELSFQCVSPTSLHTCTQWAATKLKSDLKKGGETFV